MSALDRLQDYKNEGFNIDRDKSKRLKELTESIVLSEVFDKKTPKGYLLNRIHSLGYKLYVRTFISDNGTIYNEEEYVALTSEERTRCEEQIEYSELYNVLTTTGNQEINAIAGAGKTTSLIFKILYDIATNEVTTKKVLPTGAEVTTIDGVWMGTFLRSGVVELKNAFIDWQRKLNFKQVDSFIRFATLDAEFKHCVEAMGVTLNIGTQDECNKLFMRALDACAVQTKDGENLRKEDYGALIAAFDYFRGRLDNKKYIHPTFKEYNLTPLVIDNVIDKFRKLKSNNNIVDFVDIQEMLYQYLYVTPNPEVQNFVSKRYKYIYIDEFQDVSQLQYALLKFYARGSLWDNVSNNVTDSTSMVSGLFNGVDMGTKFVAIGDPSQCIYSFKGSDSSILVKDFDKDFRPSFCTLSVNWRCPKNILDPVVPSIHMNADSENQRIVAAKDGGEFHIYEYNSIDDMTKHLNKMVLADVQKGKTVAILCRTNLDGAIPAFMLESQNNLNFGLSSEDMTMMATLPKKLSGMSSLFTERSTPTVRDSLQMIVPFGGKYHIKELIDTLKANTISIWDVDLADIRYSCPELLDYVVEVRRVIMEKQADGSEKRIKDRDIEGLKATYDYLIRRVYKSDSPYNQSARAYIEVLLTLLDSKKYKSIYDFTEDLVSINRNLTAKVGEQNVNVKVATVHDYKGKECDCVYVWNDSDKVFPSPKCDLNDDFEVAEERRVHYIACTRAKEKSVIMTLRGKVGKFVLEMQHHIETPTIE